MDKKIISIELSEKEYEDLKKAFEKTKASNLVFPSVGLEDFVKQIVMAFVKGPSLDELNGMDIGELLGQLKDMVGGNGDMSNFMDAFGGLNKNKQESKDNKIQEAKPEEEEYKS